MNILTSYTGLWDKPHLYHLLRRCLFGVSIDSMRVMEGKSLEACVDMLLSSGIRPEPSPPVNTYNEEFYKDPIVAPGAEWVDAPETLGEVYEVKRNNNLKAWWAGQIINQETNVTEKMVLFWHNHFATQSYDMLDSRYTYKHITLLRKHALGNFKTLAREITTDPCMLVYQNGNANAKGKPNENYGRELQEMFTVGKGPDSHYTEEDVKAAARVLTGWCDNKKTISSHFESEKHDTSDKIFSAFYNNTIIKGKAGTDGAKETDELIEMLFGKEQTAKHLCRKLYRWFVHYDIDEIVERDVIMPLSDVLIKNKFEIRPVLRTLFLSQWFYDKAVMGKMIKSGTDYGFGLVRQFDFEFPPASDIVKQYNAWYVMAGGIAQLLQDIGDPPSVAGWPAYYEAPSYYNLWVDSDLLQARQNIAKGMASLYGIPSDDAGIFKFDFIKFVSKLNDATSADKLIERSFLHLLCMPASQNQTAFLRDKLNGANGTSWSTLWAAFAADRSNKALAGEVDIRLSSFFSVILSLGEYQMM